MTTKKGDSCDPVYRETREILQWHACRVHALANEANRIANRIDALTCDYKAVEGFVALVNWCATRAAHSPRTYNLDHVAKVAFKFLDQCAHLDKDQTYTEFAMEILVLDGNPILRDAWCLYVLLGQVNNGGFAQWIGNRYALHSGDQTLEAIDRVRTWLRGNSRSASDNAVAAVAEVENFVRQAIAYHYTISDGEEDPDYLEADCDLGEMDDEMYDTTGNAFVNACNEYFITHYKQH